MPPAPASGSSATSCAHEAIRLGRLLARAHARRRRDRRAARPHAHPRRPPRGARGRRRQLRRAPRPGPRALGRRADRGGPRQLDRALRLRRARPYQLQAAIAALHRDGRESTGRRSPRSTGGCPASRPHRWSRSTAPSRGHGRQPARRPLHPGRASDPPSIATSPSTWRTPSCCVAAVTRTPADGAYAPRHRAQRECSGVSGARATARIAAHERSTSPDRRRPVRHRDAHGAPPAPRRRPPSSTCPRPAPRRPRHRWPRRCCRSARGPD